MQQRGIFFMAPFAAEKLETKELLLHSLSVDDYLLSRKGSSRFWVLFLRYNHVKDGKPNELLCSQQAFQLKQTGK